MAINHNSRAAVEACYVYSFAAFLLSAMSKAILLQLIPVAEHPLLDTLDQFYERILLPNALSSPELDALAPKVELILTSATTSTCAALIDRLPALKAICSIGVGYDAIAVQHAQQKNIVVSNTPDVLNDCVADLAWGLIISAARQIPQADRFVRNNAWTANSTFPLSSRVSGKKLGIVGLGRIGEAIAQRGQGFSMQIRYHNRHQRPDVSWGYAESLIELAQWADILLVATVGGDSTRHLINQTVLEALGPQGLLINIARGSVVDQEALVMALQNGTLGAAGLDVYTDEPGVPAALRELEQVVLTPHIASATQETRKAMLELALSNLLSVHSSGRCLTPIPLL